MVKIDKLGKEELQCIRRDLDMSIFHWKSFIKRGLGYFEKEKSFVYEGEVIYPEKLIGSCVLCDKADNECDRCIMSGRWSKGKTCFSSSSPYKKWLSSVRDPGFYDSEIFENHSKVVKDMEKVLEEVVQTYVDMSERQGKPTYFGSPDASSCAF